MNRALAAVLWVLFSRGMLHGASPSRHFMEGSVTYSGQGLVIEGETSTGRSLVFDGDGEASISPVQSVLLAHGACSLIDVVDGLRRWDIESADVSLKGGRSEAHPRVFTSVSLSYTIVTNAPEDLVRRLVESSHDKYCSVGAMITGAGAELSWTLDVQQSS